MESLLLWIARVAAIAGILICALAVATRLSGTFFLLGTQTGTLLQAGMAVMLVGCLSFLALLTRRQ